MTIVKYNTPKAQNYYNLILITHQADIHINNIYRLYSSLTRYGQARPRSYYTISHIMDMKSFYVTFVYQEP